MSHHLLEASPMSEPSSLYARIHLSEPALRAFVESRPTRPAAYGDWRGWLDRASFYGTISDAAIAAMEPSAEPSVRAYLDALCRPVVYEPSRERYDPATQTWTLTVLQYAENYGDFIDILTIIRAITAYKDLPGDDVILIYPFLWGGEPEAYLRIAEGASHFEQQVPGDVIAEADAYFRQLCDEYTDSIDVDAL
jgi:hypothetical protein